MKSSKVATPAYKLMKRIEKIVRERVKGISDDYVIKSRMVCGSTGEIYVYSGQDFITHVCIDAVVLVGKFFQETIGDANVYYGICDYNGKGCIKISVTKFVSEK